MSNRAAVYTVQIHPKGDPKHPVQLGDFDGQGHWLATVLDGYLAGLDVVDGTRRLRCLSSEIDGEEILIMLEHCLGGLDAMIRSKDGAVKAHQEIYDSQDVECGCLLRLARNDRIGWLAVHVPGGRGTKTMLGDHLRKRFQAKYNGLVLAITPYVLESALKKAVDSNLVQQVKLVKRVEPSDRAMFGVEQWIGGDRDYGKIEVTIGARYRQRAQHLLTAPLQRFLAGQDGARSSARAAIVEFGGLTFDEAKVVVTQPSGNTRTFNIEHPDSGHPFTELMQGLGDGKPQPGEIINALRAALRTTGS